MKRIKKAKPDIAAFRKNLAGSRPRAGGCIWLRELSPEVREALLQAREDFRANRGGWKIVDYWRNAVEHLGVQVGETQFRKFLREPK
jgi:hypothetical protein